MTGLWVFLVRYKEIYSSLLYISKKNVSIVGNGYKATAEVKREISAVTGIIYSFDVPVFPIDVYRTAQRYNRGQLFSTEL